MPGDDAAYVALEIPAREGWLAPPGPEVDAGPWARQVLAAEGDLVEEVAEMLASMVFAARTSPLADAFAHLAAVFLPDPRQLVRALLSAGVLPIADGEVWTTEQLLREAGLDEDPLVEVETVPVTIAFGSGVRRRRLLPAPSGPGETGSVLEGLTYAVLPRELPGHLQVDVTWGDLPLGDQLAAEADAVVDSLLLTFEQ